MLLGCITNGFCTAPDRDPNSVEVEEADGRGGAGVLSDKFFSRCASHRCTASSVRMTGPKDISVRASGRHWRRASRALRADNDKENSL